MILQLSQNCHALGYPKSSSVATKYSKVRGLGRNIGGNCELYSIFLKILVFSVLYLNCCLIFLLENNFCHLDTETRGPGACCSDKNGVLYTALRGHVTETFWQGQNCRKGSGRGHDTSQACVSATRLPVCEPHSLKLVEHESCGNFVPATRRTNFI